MDPIYSWPISLVILLVVFLAFERLARKISAQKSHRFARVVSSHGPWLERVDASLPMTHQRLPPVRWTDRAVRIEPVDAVSVPGYSHAHMRYFSSRLASGEAIYVGFADGIPWLSVHAHRRRRGDTDGNHPSEYREYGFSRRRQNWSHGMAPAGAMEVRDVIEAVVSHMEH